MNPVRPFRRAAGPAVPTFLLALSLSGCALMALPEMQAPRDPRYREDPTADAAAAAELVNQRRQGAGCAPLVWLEGAGRVAQGHSDDMAARNYFGHQSPEGHRLGERLAAAGVRHHGAAENLARVPGGARDAVGTWMASAVHRRNMLNCAYTHHGLGVRDGRWTHVLLTEPPR
jgi:uncharacterized protein YkwD